MNIEVVLLSTQYAVKKKHLREDSRTVPLGCALVRLSMLASSCGLCGFPSDVLVCSHSPKNLHIYCRRLSRCTDGVPFTRGMLGAPASHYPQVWVVQQTKSARNLVALAWLLVYLHNPCKYMDKNLHPGTYISTPEHTHVS